MLAGTQPPSSGVPGEWAATMLNFGARRSWAVSRSYWVCNPIQNAAELPKKRENSRAVSAVIERCP
jgi:hypothetical protein